VWVWLLLAESHMTRRLFGAMVGRIAALLVPTVSVTTLVSQPPGSASVPPGRQPVVVTVSGVSSPPVNITVQPAP